MCGCVQLSKRCFQVSGSNDGHMGQVMDGYKVGVKNNCLRAFPIYWLYLNLRRQVFWEIVTSGCVQKFVEVGISMLVSVVHFAMFGKEAASVCRYS
jgi:hypothetical protein